jgi:hypothetical protein
MPGITRAQFAAALRAMDAIELREWHPERRRARRMTERVSAWKDAANTEIPACPKCTAVNRPKLGDSEAAVYIEIVNHEYVCRVCGHGWRR